MTRLKGIYVCLESVKCKDCKTTLFRYNYKLHVYNSKVIFFIIAQKRLSTYKNNGKIGKFSENFPIFPLILLYLHPQNNEILC